MNDTMVNHHLASNNFQSSFKKHFPWKFELE